MTRRPQTVVFASNNAGKVAEVASIVAAANVVLVPQSEFAVPEAAETGLTFVENALLKARNACRHTDKPALADDSGLVVDALAGAPGIRSARYAGDEASDAANNALLLEALRGLPPEQRVARFVCVLAFLRHAEDPLPLICHGIWPGRILQEPRGEHGFGYDPLFQPDDAPVSAAELDPERKNSLSHRGRALRELLAKLSAIREQ